MATRLIDDTGKHHHPVEGKAKILSLVPSLTELLFDLGLGAGVVGRTDYCIHPALRVAGVPSVGGTKQIDLQQVAALAPTHALVNIDETPKEMAQALTDSGIEVVVTHPLRLTDNRRLFELIGGIFNAQEKATSLIRNFDSALTDLRKRSTTWSDVRVLYLIWRKPWMSISSETYIAAVLAEAKMHVIEHADPARYPEFTLDEELLQGVERVLFSTEPFPFKMKHLDTFAHDFPAHAHKACLIDSEMVSWYGSRAIPGLRYLADFTTGLSS
jgi:ABC-type Fe3+-hydroxamate transport system substrate-binding protein